MRAYLFFVILFIFYYFVYFLLLFYLFIFVCILLLLLLLLLLLFIYFVTYLLLFFQVCRIVRVENSIVKSIISPSIKCSNTGMQHCVLDFCAHCPAY